MKVKLNHYLKFTILVSALSFSVFASNETGVDGNKVKLDSVMKDSLTEDYKQLLMAKLEKLNFLSAEFKQTVFDGEGNTLQTGSGKLLLSKPNLVRWETIEPDESLIVSDGDTLWFFDPFIEQVSAYRLKSAIANTPILLLTNQEPSLWNNYQVSQIDQVTFLIHALDTNSQVKTLELNFIGEQLAGFVILDATGQLSRVELSNVDTENSPSMDNFQFKLTEGIYLDDQR